MSKSIVLFANTTNVSGETISEPAVSSTTGAPTWSSAKSEYDAMDVVLDVKTLTGTSPTITFSIQEQFGGIFAETAKSTAISATGKYILVSKGVPSSQTANVQGQFPALGRGIAKQVVTTAGGTIGTLSADIYLVFHKGD